MNDESIFADAAAITDPVRRQAFLDRECRGNDVLRREIEKLLAAHLFSNPLDQPPQDLANTGLYHASAGQKRSVISEGPGTIIGSYKLMEKIGEGGMGLVFVAEQQKPIRRKVALKVIKPGMDTHQVMARFEAERQALALMDHPHIARVLDAGSTDTGRPYFVMELVRGVPITEYADANNLPPKERLQLFIQVCQAVQHAHQKGVIHRDLKPSNILVAPHDGIPIVKVIDFGVAKALGHQLTDKTIYTQFSQMIGTPLYMSPEQAEVNQLDVDTRSDIYSLGVLLYELLTGTTPIDRQRFQQAAFDEIRRIIREEEPPRPSTRITSLGSTLPSISSQRGTEAKRLAALVRGELDWIVMRCLEKDRTRRYDTAVGLAKDVQRYLDDETVEARPPSTIYRFSKMARRNKVAITTASLVGTALLLGLGVSIWQAVRATHAERMAAQQRDIAVEAEELANREKSSAIAAREELRQTLYATDLNLAGTLWQDHDRDRTIEILDRNRPQPNQVDLRGFEWHYLNRECRSGTHSLELPTGYKSFTPDGSRVFVSIHPDQRIDGKTGLSLREWDVKTGREMPEYKPYPTDDAADGIILGFSTNGKRMIVSARIRDPNGQERVEDKVVDVETRQDLFVLPQVADTVRLMLRSFLDEEGRRLVEVKRPLLPFEAENSLTVWDVDRKELVRTITLDASQDEHFSFGFSLHPNGKRFAAIVHKIVDGRPVANSYELRIWDLDSGKEVSKVPMNEGQGPGLLQYSPKGQYLALSPAETNLIELRDPESGQILHELTISRGRKGDVRQSELLFSPDGTWLAASKVGEKSVSVWELDAKRLATDRTPVRVILEEMSGVSSSSFSSDNRAILFTDANREYISSYDLTQRSAVVTGPTDAPQLPPDQVTCDSTASKFAGVWHVRDGEGGRYEIKVWDSSGRILFTTAHELISPDHFEQNSFNFRMTLDGSRMFLSESCPLSKDATQYRNSIRVWDLNSRKELHHGERTEEGDLYVHEVHQDGHRLVTSRTFTDPTTRPFTKTTRLAIWNLATDREEHGIEIAGVDNAATLSADGTRVAWCYALHRPSWINVLSVWDTATGREVWSDNGSFRTPTFSSDGQNLMVSNFGGEVHLLDAATGNRVRPPLLCQNGSLTQIHMSPDGRRLFGLATLDVRNRDAEQRAIVWDLVTGRELLNLPATHNLLFSLDADGRRLHWIKQNHASSAIEMLTWYATPLPDGK
jgi:serine/threonine protein kinase/WD40 repeat protein